MLSLSVVEWIAVVLGILLMISETLPFTESVKSNGIFQGFIAVMKAIYGAIKK